MASILNTEIAAELTDALECAELPYDCTLIRKVSSGSDLDPTLTDVSYPCRGWRDQYELDLVNDTRVQENDVRIFVLTSSTTIQPTTADKITLDGVTYSIVSVRTDPAGAYWDIQGRD